MPTREGTTEPNNHMLSKVCGIGNLEEYTQAGWRMVDRFQERTDHVHEHDTRQKAEPDNGYSCVTVTQGIPVVLENTYFVLEMPATWADPHARIVELERELGTARVRLEDGAAAQLKLEAELSEQKSRCDEIQKTADERYSAAYKAGEEKWKAEQDLRDTRKRGIHILRQLRETIGKIQFAEITGIPIDWDDDRLFDVPPTVDGSAS